MVENEQYLVLLRININISYILNMYKLLIAGYIEPWGQFGVIQDVLNLKQLFSPNTKTYSLQINLWQ